MTQRFCVLAASGLVAIFSFQQSRVFATPTGVWRRFTAASLRLSLAAGDVERLFTCSRAARTAPLVKWPFEDFRIRVVCLPIF